MSSSVGHNSLIMASGTIASRVTGQIRTIFLVGALGTTGIAANAYQAGAQIPQVIYNLISTGLFNAVLVPQIVRTLKQRDADERLSKLITLAVVLLLAITGVMMAGTPLLTSIYLDSSWTAAQRALANAFTFWCMPQILFYGLYTVVGQILAAKGRFGMYAWSSVGANVISCVGFGAFMLLFGNAANQPLDFWTPAKIALTAGAWTAGVAFQALVLFLPLLRSGIHYRPRLGLRGLGLRSMGKVALWSIAMVFVNQAMNIINTRVTTGAPAAGGDLNGIAGNASYQYAYTLYILPYSVIAASLATAVFPRISAAVSEKRIDDARESLSSALRSNSLAMLFFMAAMAAMPVPLVKALIPSASLHGALLIAPVLLALLLGLLPASAYLLMQRAFYAWEDGKSPFIFALVSCGIQVVILLGSVMVAPAEDWAMLVALALSLSFVLSFPVVYLMLRKRFGGNLDGRRLAVMHVKTLLAALAAFAAGRVVCGPVTRLVGADTSSGQGHLNWGQSLVICAVVTIVVGAVYAALLMALRVNEFTGLVNGVMRRFKRRAAAVPASAAPAASEAPTTTTASTTAEAPADATAPAAVPPSFTPTVERRRSTDTSKGQSNTSAASKPGAPMARMQGAAFGKADHTPDRGEGTTGIMKPQLSDTVFDRYTLVERLRAQPGLEAWKANDRVLAQDCQLFFITAREALDSVDRVASSLVISSNDRFTQVLQSRREDDCTVLVTRLDSGQSLSDYLEQVDDRDGQPGKPLSYDAMRSILGDVAYALTSTREGMISTDTIRISTAGVEVADAPLAALAEEPSGADALTMGERLVVRQLAAVLYAMLTHTPSSKIDRYDFSRLPINMPGEFQVILRRGLNLTSEGGHVEPMASLAEFKALLGYWRTVPDLSYEHDLALPSEASEPSIVQLPLRHVDDDQVAEVPASMLTAEPLPELTIEDAVSAQPSPTYMPTAAINVSHLSILEAEPMGVGESTTVIPLFDESMASSSADEAEPAFDGDTADDDGGTDTAFAMDMPGADGLQPPSFTPAVAHRNTPDEPEDGLEDLSDEPLFGKFTTKVIAIVVGAVLLLLALVFAMISLTHSDMNPPTDRSTNWPDQNTEDVPFGDSANSSDSTDPAATASAATDDATWFIQTQDSHGWLA